MVGINTNVSALNARAALDTNSVNQAQAMQQLSTGLRINSAKDDAAGLAIATKMNSNIKGIAVAVKNANDGISMAQTAESSLGSVTNMLQRMRELAVQASNGTLTSSNRASVQVEVTQLASEINNIGKTANFNGIKLFDGSASSVTLQTNINSGDVVKMGIAQMNTSVLGVGTVPSVQGVGQKVQTISSSNANDLSAKALVMGDVVINGIMVGATKAADDTVSYDNNGVMNANNASSAIAKAAAINAISSQTGVKATVQSNIVSGVAMTAGTAGHTGTFTINGVTTQAVSLTGNTAADRVSTVNALNAISAATGVRAVDTQSNSTGVQLIADDGRNIYAYGTYSGASKGIAFGIDVDANSTTAATAATQNVFIAGVSLQSTTSSPVVISTTASGNLTKAGLSAGTYAANSAIYASAGKQSTQGSSASGAYSLSAGDMVINGTAIAASVSADDTVSYTTGTAASSTSAISIAAAINKSTTTTGVTASANANVIQGSGFSAVAFSGAVVINGASVTFASGDSTTIDAVALKINSITGQSGVVATNNGSGITLSAADGRNITIAVQSATSNASLAAIGLVGSNMAGALNQTLANINITQGSTASTAAQTTTFFSTVSLSSSKVFTVSGGAGASTLTDLAALGFREGTYGGSSNGVKISQLDLSTAAGASTALGAIDAAIGQISDQRSNLGAIQNRLQSSVDNLTSSGTNLQAAQGRIQDTDYSTTTTVMSKSQIISQAATAMLAQANQQPQMVLSLLK